MGVGDHAEVLSDWFGGDIQERGFVLLEMCLVAFEGRSYQIWQEKLSWKQGT